MLKVTCPNVWDSTVKSMKRPRQGHKKKRALWPGFRVLLTFSAQHVRCWFWLPSWSNIPLSPCGQDWGETEFPAPNSSCFLSSHSNAVAGCALPKAICNGFRVHLLSPKLLLIATRDLCPQETKEGKRCPGLCHRLNKGKREGREMWLIDESYSALNN